MGESWCSNDAPTFFRANNWRATGSRRDEAYHLSMILYWREEHLQLPCAAIFVGKSIWTTHLWQLGLLRGEHRCTQKRMRFQKRHGFWENLNEFEVIQTFGCCWYDVSSWYINFLDVSFQINSTSTEFCEVASAWIPQNLGSIISYLDVAALKLKSYESLNKHCFSISRLDHQLVHLVSMILSQFHTSCPALHSFPILV